MNVRKSNGSIEEYDIGKLKNGIVEAFLSVKEIPSEEAVNSVVDNLYLYDKIESKEIRRQVEEALMSLNKKAARAYIKKFVSDSELKERVSFNKAYIDACNASSGSKYDSNANVSNKNIATLNAEIPKKGNIQFNRYNTANKIKTMFSKKLAEQYIKDLESHIIYKHDESTFGINSPYTYGAKEVVEVYYNQKHLLTPFDLLWEIVTEAETLIDEEKGVWQKFPKDLKVRERDNKFVNVPVITKKKRHRDLARLKTSYGEDFIVTDNHPLIIDKDNINNNIDAIDGLGKTQYKTNDILTFGNQTEIDLSGAPNIEDKGKNYCLDYSGTAYKKKIEVGWELGYFTGFFVGDGNYNNANGQINITQKDRETLVRLNEMLFESMGITGRIRYKRDKSNCYVLSIANNALWWLFKEIFKIQDKAENKTLPINTMDYTEEFSKGLLCGLMDADGTVNGAQLSIRLASRAAILQSTALLRHFGYGVGNTMQSLPFSNNAEHFNTNYTIWGVNCSARNDCQDLGESFKLRAIKELAKDSSLKYKKNGEAKITSVTKIEDNDSFLGLNEYIYDITTESRCFSMNNLLVHNCVAIQSFPFLTDGLKGLGGLSAAPKNLDSFCGMFVNLIFAVSSQFAGAVAVSGFFVMMEWYCRKEWGNEYFLHDEKPARVKYNEDGSIREYVTISKQIEQYFQEVVYGINQPAAARGFQSAFTNFAYFDKPYFEGLYGEYKFPDGSSPCWESLSYLQKKFMKWFNKERTKTMLTFPVNLAAA